MSFVFFIHLTLKGLSHEIDFDNVDENGQGKQLYIQPCAIILHL